MLDNVHQLYDEVLELGTKHGYRNAQVTVLAPTGTIAFMMDCDTTGIEPDIALIKYKKLVGEGYLKIVNGTVPAALRKLGYTPAQVEEIIAYVNERETIEGAPGLRSEHLPVFDCAFKPVNGERSIHYMGHIRMMGAVQPFLSGAISKTVNMPEAATAEEIEQVYLEGWKRGLKAIAIYRDGSKRSQPLSTGKKKDEGSAEDRDTIESLRTQLAAAQVEATRPHRRRLPSERTAVTHKFEINGHEGYITVGLYPDGQPGEIFLKMAKEGSTISGLMDTLATSVSLALQYGVPLRDVVNKFAHVRFEPSGFTGNPEIPIAKSLVDYIFRWMGIPVPAERGEGRPRADRPLRGRRGGARRLRRVGPAAARGRGHHSPVGGDLRRSPGPGRGRGSGTDTPRLGRRRQGVRARLPPSPPRLLLPRRSTRPWTSASWRRSPATARPTAPQRRTATATASGPWDSFTGSLGGGPKVAFAAQADAPSCAECGSIMVRNGSCYKCLNCGSTSGCS